MDFSAPRRGGRRQRRTRRRVHARRHPLRQQARPGDRRADGRPARRDELLAVSDVVSLHAPALPETYHLLDAPRLSLLRDGATLVNTGRGSRIDTEALTAEALSGRIHAVLDVTEPEMLPEASPLYSLPNVLLTPHIAGSLGGELRRITRSALDEVERYCAGREFAYPVTRAALTTSA